MHLTPPTRPTRRCAFHQRRRIQFPHLPRRLLYRSLHQLNHIPVHLERDPSPFLFHWPKHPLVLRDGIRARAGCTPLARSFSGDARTRHLPHPTPASKCLRELPPCSVHVAILHVVQRARTGKVCIPPSPFVLFHDARQQLLRAPHQGQRRP